jgi:phage terminase large subunit-like protein
MAKRGQQTSSTESLRAEIDDAVEGWIAKGWVIDSEWEGEPLLQTPLPHGPGIYFDHAAAERVVRFFLLLKQLIGKWAGIEFRLLDWQVRYLVAPVFGIKGPNGKRVIRTFWFEIPRKNGKSTLCSGLALYLFMADREPGAQVYAAAAAKEQAGLVFKPSRDMAAGSATIASKLGKRGIQRGRLEHPVTGAIFRALASTGDLQQGLNVTAPSSTRSTSTRTPT